MYKENIILMVLNLFNKKEIEGTFPHSFYAASFLPWYQNHTKSQGNVILYTNILHEHRHIKFSIKIHSHQTQEHIKNYPI